MSAPQENQPLKIVDTHQHLWDVKRFLYSWCTGIPSLNRSFLLEDYLEAAHGLSIEKTVFVECDVDDPYQLDEAWHISGAFGRKTTHCRNRCGLSARTRGVFQISRKIEDPDSR